VHIALQHFWSVLNMAMTTCKECGKEISDTAKTCPQCGAPVARQRAQGLPKGCSRIFLIFVAIVVFVSVLLYFGDEAHNDELKKAATPTQYVTLFMQNYNRGPMDLSLAAGKVSITLSADPWMVTDNTGLSQLEYVTRLLVPGLFAKFPDVTYVDIAATATFKDIKGNESRGPFAEIGFSRAEAASINWNKIVSGDVPKLADHFWTAAGR
jgi:predicted RNA-binding Zn-ribbon protein involved in translation (DUF1610 family)